MRTQWLAILVVLASVPAWGQSLAQGRVFHDANGDRVLGDGEAGVPDALVSNGRDVVRTGTDGRWELPVTDDTILFVIKPSGWRVPLSRDKVPQYYYIHKPNGSPPLQRAGVAPTGPLPATIDFPLQPSEEPDKFRAIFFGDTQARGIREVNFVAHDAVEELIGSDAAFGVTLGDIVADDVELFDEIAGAIGRIGAPWYYIFGNHDTNRGTNDDRLSDETFERVFGPPTYAFEYGRVCFIGLDSVYVKPEGGYEGRFTDDQLAFVANYLAQVPQDRLVVLMMHIPVMACKNGRDLMALLEGRPHTFSISAHAHEQSNHFLGEDRGWKGAEPHHHLVNATVCGSWWCGSFDELGIPHATMNDGAPNGYSIIEFDGNRYRVRFKATRRPDDYQMNIYLPDEVERAQVASTEVLVNVFAGSARSKVELRFGDDGEWMPLEQTRTTDPQCQRMHEQSAAFTVEQEELLGWKMDPPSRTSHMWKGVLGVNPEPGTYTVTVRTTDMFGQTWTAHRILRVL